VTRESVIRNRFFIDEGDPYNEILKNKTLNEIRALNFFKSVNIDTEDGVNRGSKILNIKVEEKPTGEIAALAGVGTSGNTVGFSVRENNFLGKGIGLDSNLTLTKDSIKGLFSVTNPNVYNSDKSITTTFESSELDKFSDYGYKTSKTGFLVSTNFEYLDDFRLGIGSSNYYQNIETDSTASESRKKQRGDYWDSYLKLDFDYDKRNQKFQTSSGYRSFYSLDIPLISDTNTLINSYNYQKYGELYQNNITTFSVYLNSVNSISGNDVKLSERLYIPSSKLRGFKFGAVGPKSGSDYIGGNYIGAINLISTLPQILENSQNLDFSIFFDAANVWGVDFDSSINDSNDIRSSIGIALDWLTPIGPLNFSLSQPITKSSTDEVETFRFNLGTTF
jgi:outer membrane protein insertion porin family